MVEYVINESINVNVFDKRTVNSQLPYNLNYRTIREVAVVSAEID
jgi:hypothetical protein